MMLMRSADDEHVTGRPGRSAFPAGWRRRPRFEVRCRCDTRAFWSTRYCAPETPSGGGVALVVAGSSLKSLPRRCGPAPCRRAGCARPGGARSPEVLGADWNVGGSGSALRFEEAPRRRGPSASAVHPAAPSDMRDVEVRPHAAAAMPAQRRWSRPRASTPPNSLPLGRCGRSRRCSGRTPCWPLHCWIS